MAVSKSTGTLIKYLTAVIVWLMASLAVIAQPRPKVGLVLSGGGAAGLAHIGVIRVLEEAGIPIDYVAGTSMGSIVGAMYAIGYTPDEMEKFVRSADWEMLLSDGIPRTDMTFDYKEQLEKYFYDFPIDRGKLQLPSGLIAGTNITNMLAGMTLPAYGIRNFNRLPRPFLCIGADVVTGQEVVLRNGILHDAVRASMAIPTVFTPVEVDGRLLIDGGFINNFPADHLKAMGADIIIGVDVQRELYSKPELSSVITILKQISTLTREDINARNRQLCDLLIRPHTPGASTLTFGLADSIIRTGERSARMQKEAIDRLAARLKSYGRSTEEPIRALPPVDSVYVREMAFTGLDKVDPEFIHSSLNLPFPGWMTVEEIFRGMQRAYGTNEFEKVTYQIDPVTEGVRLTVRAVEKKQNLVHVGLHFDNLFNASLLARGDFRNLLRKGDQLGVDLNLGENPNLRASYFFLFRKKYHYGFAAEFGRLQAYEYQDTRKIASSIYRDFSLDLMLRTTYKKRYAAILGLQGEMAWINPNIGDWELRESSHRMINAYVRLKKDNFNRIPYPTKGDKAEITILQVNEFPESGHNPCLVLDLRYKKAFELTPKFSLQPSFAGSLAFGRAIPYPYRSYVGGLGYYHQSVIPFAGMDYMARATNHALVVRTDLQYRLRNNHFLMMKLNAGKCFDAFGNFSDPGSTLAGIGLTYGYASPIGPVEVTVMQSNASDSPILFLNLGYWIH